MYKTSKQDNLLDSLRELLTDGDMFVICSPGGLVSYCSGTLRELVDEDLRGRSLHYFISDEDAARIILSAQTGQEADVSACIGNKHFRCRMRPSADKTFVMVFMPVSPEGSAFMRHSSAVLMQREIRDSIQVILAALGQMTPPEQPNDKLYQAMIRRQALRVLRLGDNMMDLAQYQNRSVKLNAEELDLDDLIREFADNLRNMLAASNVRIVTELPDKACMIRADREKLLRILCNLVCNSVQAAMEQPLLIYMRLSYQHGQYRILYRDDLPGDPDIVERLFNKHLTEDPFSSEALGGAGFGLSLVKAFTDLHGGNLVITADPQGKPTFVVCLDPENERTASTLRGDNVCYQDGAQLLLKELSPVLDLSCYMK